MCQFLSSELLPCSTWQQVQFVAQVNFGISGRSSSTEKEGHGKCRCAKWQTCLGTFLTALTARCQPACVFLKMDATGWFWGGSRDSVFQCGHWTHDHYASCEPGRHAGLSPPSPTQSEDPGHTASTWKSPKGCEHAQWRARTGVR